MPSGYHFLKVKVAKLEKELKETQDERWTLQNKVRDLEYELEQIQEAQSKIMFFNMIDNVQALTGWERDPPPAPDPPKEKAKKKKVK